MFILWLSKVECLQQHKNVYLLVKKKILHFYKLLQKVNKKRNCLMVHSRVLSVWKKNLVKFGYHVLSKVKEGPEAFDFHYTVQAALQGRANVKIFFSSSFLVMNFGT